MAQDALLKIDGLSGSRVQSLRNEIQEVLRPLQ